MYAAALGTSPWPPKRNPRLHSWSQPRQEAFARLGRSAGVDRARDAKERLPKGTHRDVTFSSLYSARVLSHQFPSITAWVTYLGKRDSFPHTSLFSTYSWFTMRKTSGFLSGRGGRASFCSLSRGRDTTQPARWSTSQSPSRGRRSPGRSARSTSTSRRVPAQGPPIPIGTYLPGPRRVPLAAGASARLPLGRGSPCLAWKELGCSAHALR
mmetsp:Transcript_95802/g.271184  ORF Transcript_95802/g.271184 Transcript_95802/m.271184 type:complete len:211 (-) Transcript_95802:126-758(-)